MGDWSFADVWEAVADALPDIPAVVQGERIVRWSEFDSRADGIAEVLLGVGLRRQDKVAQYLYNCPEYLETVFGSLKASLVPVNTNYRYVEDELAYLWDNADVAAVVFDSDFTDRVAVVRARVPGVRLWVCVGDCCPAWAVPYEEAAQAATARVFPPWGRSGDDLYLLYTGGTTGLPKGVMWRVDDLFALLNAVTVGVSYPYECGLASVKAALEEVALPRPVGLPASPLMHGAGAFTAFNILSGAGTVVLLSGRAFDAEGLLDTIERERVGLVALIGDAFAKPLLQALDAAPGRWDLSSLEAIGSSGVMWSEETKRGLLRHHPGMQLVDAFASSEAPGMGVSVSGGGAASDTAAFVPGSSARVLDDRGLDVVPGSGTVGRVAVTGVLPIGYYKDAEKTAATFMEIDGIRYSMPGDYATVEENGCLRLLGRGSLCVNTGGEKVFPEEVEQVLKQHDSIFDAVVVGIPDERLGEAVAAVVQPEPGVSVDEEDIRSHVKQRLASYKAPRHILVVETLGRAPNGKADYVGLRRLALDGFSTRSP